MPGGWEREEVLPSLVSGEPLREGGLQGEAWLGGFTHLGRCSVIARVLFSPQKQRLSVPDLLMELNTRYGRRRGL